MALVTVGHPIPGLTAYERFDDFSLAFVGGISGRINLSTGQQTQLTGLGYVINPATPAYESPYVLDSELESQLPARLSAVELRAALGPAAIVAPPATGVAAVDTVNLQKAINDCPAGGRVFVPWGTYKLNDSLTIPRSISIEGDSITSLYTPGSQGGSTSIPRPAPYLAGTLLQQTAAGKNIIDATTSAISLNLYRLGLIFADGLTSTGHGVNGVPTLAITNGLDFGLTDFHWEDVTVYGHDGNHFAVMLHNEQYGTIVNFRSYGGGGLHIQSDEAVINSGNLVFIHPFINVFKAGTADGIVHHAAITSGHPGQINLITYVRPQVAISLAARTQGTQRPWNDAAGPGVPKSITVYDIDLEGLAATNQPVFGQYTVRAGISLVDGGNARDGQGVAIGQTAAGKTAYNVGQFAAVGLNALAEQTTGQQNAAFGYNALASLSTATSSTGLGNQAGRYATGQQNTAVGANALLGVSGQTTGTFNTAIGYTALTALTTGSSNTGLGMSALGSATTGGSNTAIGRDAGKFTGGSNANAIVAGNSNAFVGYQSGSNAGDISHGVTLGNQALVAANAVAIGSGAVAGASGAVAIGRDSSGGAATTATANEFKLGTANHLVTVAGRLNVAQRTPTSSADTQGRVGDITSDDNYVYAKTSTGWKRAALTTW